MNQAKSKKKNRLAMSRGFSPAAMRQNFGLQKEKH